MAARKIKTKDDLANEEADYLYWQSRYNETGDIKIIWDHMYSYLVDTLESCIRKIVGQHRPKYMSYREVAEDGALVIIKRYVRDQSYCKNKPKTLCYLEARNLCASSVYFPRSEYTDFNVEDINNSVNRLGSSLCSIPQM